MFNKVFTIGCFDQFHIGHQKLLENMKNIGKEIIVGVHDDNSIEKLKNLKREEHDDIKTRMDNVKKYADVVFVIPDTDPTFFIKSMVHNQDNKNNSCFIRGDDMPNFPSKDFIETKMSIIFLPYYKGISSTQIRSEKKNN